MNGRYGMGPKRGRRNKKALTSEEDLLRVDLGLGGRSISRADSDLPGAEGWTRKKSPKGWRKD